MGRFNKPKSFGKREFSRSSSPGRPERRPDREDFSRPRRNSELEMTSAVCAKCGKSCEIPFKPTGKRPVYCRSCFTQTAPSEPGNESRNFASRDRYSNRSESRSGSSSEELDKINRKLDKIMRALDID